MDGIALEIMVQTYSMLTIMLETMMKNRVAQLWFPVVLGITVMATAGKAGASSWIGITPKITVKTCIMITVMWNMELVRNIMSEDSLLLQLVRDIMSEGSMTQQLVMDIIMLNLELVWYIMSEDSMTQQLVRNITIVLKTMM